MKKLLVRILMVGLLALGSTSFVGCSSIPNRYTNIESIKEGGPANRTHEGLGWVISEENDSGFYLEVLYFSFKWTFCDDEDIIDAKRCFKKVGIREAKNRGYSVKNILNSDISCTVVENYIDGNLSIFTKGLVKYK